MVGTIDPMTIYVQFPAYATEAQVRLLIKQLEIHGWQYVADSWTSSPDGAIRVTLGKKP